MLILQAPPTASTRCRQLKFPLAHKFCLAHLQLFSPTPKPGIFPQYCCLFLLEGDRDELEAFPTSFPSLLSLLQVPPSRIFPQGCFSATFCHCCSPRQGSCRSQALLPAWVSSAPHSGLLLHQKRALPTDNGIYGVLVKFGLRETGIKAAPKQPKAGKIRRGATAIPALPQGWCF